MTEPSRNVHHQIVVLALVCGLAIKFLHSAILALQHDQGTHYVLSLIHHFADFGTLYVMSLLVVVLYRVDMLKRKYLSTQGPETR